MKNWFKRGFDAGSAAMEKERKAKESGGKRSPAGNRFWMPKDSEKSVVFLTEEPFIYLEHNWKSGSSYRNWGTCMSPLDEPCGYCDLSFNKYQAAAFTVVDCSPWTDKDGNEHRFTKRLFIAKSGVWETIERKRRLLKEDGHTLRGAAFRIFRGKDPKSPGVGEDFEFRKMIDLDNWEFKDTDDYDFAEILMPNVDAMNEVVTQFGGAPVGAASAAPVLDDPPF